MIRVLQGCDFLSTYCITEQDNLMQRKVVNVHKRQAVKYRKFLTHREKKELEFMEATKVFL